MHADSAPPKINPLFNAFKQLTRLPKLVYLVIGIVIILLLSVVGLYILISSQLKVNDLDNYARHNQSSPNMHRIQHIDQTLRVGINPDFPPMAFLPDSQSNLVGYNIDLANAIGRELHTPVTLVPFNFRPTFSAERLGNANPLLQQEVDIVIDNISSTPAARQYYEFTDPYLKAGQVAITHDSRDHSISSTDALGLRLAVVEESSGAVLAGNLKGVSKVSRYANYKEAVKAVSEGQVDAYIADAPLANHIVKNNQDLKISSELLTQEGYSIAVLRGHSDITNDLNRVLATLNQKGVLESLQQKWLR